MIKQDCNISFRDATISSIALLEQRKKKGKSQSTK